jgi:protein SCO1
VIKKSMDLTLPLTPLPYKATFRGEQSEQVSSKYLVRVQKCIILLLLLIILTGCYREDPTPTPEAGEDLSGISNLTPQLIPDFTLIDQNDTDIQLSDFHGKMVLLYFGFTHCPDFCPATLNDYKLIKETLGENAGDVVFLFVSVDPGRDTPEVLNRYLARFDPSFTAATADASTLSEMTSALNTTYEIEDHEHGESYAVGHSSSKFLLDREGNLITVYSFGTPYEMVAEDIRNKLDS